MAWYSTPVRTFTFLLVLLLQTACNYRDGESTPDEVAKALESADLSLALPVSANSARLLAGNQPVIRLEFTPQGPDSKYAPVYSPTGQAHLLAPIVIDEELGSDGMTVELHLGWPENSATHVRVLLARGMNSVSHNLLYVDSNGNGLFDDGQIEGEAVSANGQSYMNFRAVLPVKYIFDEVVHRSYPVQFWWQLDDPSETPEVLYFSRRGFMQATATLRGENAVVILSDGNNDAIFEQGDWWEIIPQGSSSSLAAMRKVGDFGWFGDDAYQLKVDDFAGRVATLSPVNPQISKSEDARRRDPFDQDRQAERASSQLLFESDLDQAKSEANREQKHILAVFRTDWCCESNALEDLVLGSKDVVDIAQWMVCVKIDVDADRAVAKALDVLAHPTVLILDGDGNELARYEGYQSVKQMTQFLEHYDRSTQE